MKHPGRFPRFLGLLGLAVVLSLGYMSRTSSTVPKGFSMMEAAVKPAAECPSDKPLDCGNGWCCGSGYTLHCPRSTCTDDFGKALDKACINPDRLTDEELAHARNCCPELASCGNAMGDLEMSRVIATPYSIGMDRSARREFLMVPDCSSRARLYELGRRPPL